MIARWQRTLLLFILLTMAAWLVWQWPHSPLRAVLGALVPLSIYLVVMAVEFVLMHITNRTDAAPAPAYRRSWVPGGPRCGWRC